jgi:FAD/FMN-containing dehydrogenase
MKRRTFCRSALSVAGASLFPGFVRAALDGDVPAVSGAGKQVVISAQAAKDLQRRLSGQLLAQGMEGYDSARRIWNGMFDRKPALIAQCINATDVSHAVRFAKEHDLLVAVRGGGHSLSGQSVCDGGLMIDLSKMQATHVDPAKQVARIEPGVLLGKLDAATQAHGLVTPAGTISHTGAAGLTLGGGFGRLARKLGLACDNLIAADVVTANGDLVRASLDENPELLWGLRGGGGNFGVVTSFEYRLHRVGPQVLGGPIVYPYSMVRDVLGFLADFMAEAPDELYMELFLISPSPEQRALVIDVTWCGPIESGERALQPLKQFRKPVQDGVRPATYVQVQSSGDGNSRHGRNYYTKSGFVRGLEPALLDAIMERFGTAPQAAMIAIPQQGGAIARIKPDATAFWNRGASHSVIAQAGWDDPADNDRNIAWVRETWAAMEPFTNGFYVNIMAYDDSSARVRGTYGDNYQRLVALKRQFDPTNLFRMNANIPPT